MTVSVLSVSARGNDEIAVTFEIKEGDMSQRECFLLSARLFADLRIAVGESSRECFDATSEAAELYRATKKGLTLLSYGASSEKALQRKLMMKGFPKDISVRAVKELSDEGYINEESDALREAERSAAKLWGKKRIAAHLYEKGFSDKAVKSAIYGIEDSGTDFTELCAERLRRTAKGIPEDQRERQKLIASLIRYGFSMSEIKEAFETVSNDE